AYAGNHGPALGQRHRRAEFVVVAVKIVDVLGDNLAFEILPGAASDAIAGIDGLRAAGCLGAEVGAPGLVARARGLGQRLALTFGSLQAAEVGALARPAAGDEEGHVRRLRRRLLCQARGRAEWHSRN